ncbi:MAG: SMP-30/gluconolactonase/LRE family protein [Pseudomonadales bacterium]
MNAPLLAAPIDKPADTGVSQIACAEVNGIRPVCGFTNPEDLVVVPGGKLLLVSEMGAFMSDAPNTLSLLNVGTNSRQTIEIHWDPLQAQWGDSNCAAPAAEKFSPHGIDLMTRADGRHQLLVVNHGNEQVEFFELMKPEGRWVLHWKGCAKPTGDPFINDVAGLKDGGFVATHMWDKSLPFEEVVRRLTSGVKTGWVWEWQVETGFTKLAHSEEMMPNGIAVNEDNSKIFVNIYMGNKTIRIDRESGLVDAEFAVKNPDNIAVDPQGSLWVASHLNDPIEGRCEEGHAGPCLLPFRVVKADPITMEPEVVFEHEGEPMGYVTVALPVNGRVYFGTASGDRIASVAIQ